MPMPVIASRLLMVATSLVMVGCIGSKDPLFGQAEVPFDGVPSGYWQYCGPASATSARCTSLQLRRTGPASFEQLVPGRDEASDLVFERLDAAHFIVQQKAPFAGYSYGLATQASDGTIFFTDPSCKLIGAQRQKFADEGVEVDVEVGSDECKPREASAAAMRQFFSVIVDLHIAGDRPPFVARPISESEGSRAFADADGVRDAHLVLSTLRSRLSDSGASNAYGTSQELANQRMLTAMTDTISQLKELRAKTYDPALRTFYYRTGLALSDLNDLLTVEKTLILATENDNLGLWKGAAEAFANEELKRLAAPAASTLELQIRLRDFDKTYRRTQDGVARQLQAANSDLMRERNIDFSDDLHGLFH